MSQSPSKTDEEIKQEMLEFLAFFDNKIPNIKHEPKRFEYYVKMFRHCKQHQDKIKEIAHES